MDTLMLVVTAASLVVATVATVIAWRVTRNERARRDARVAALATAAGVTSTAVRAAEATPADADRAPGGLQDFMPARAAVAAPEAAAEMPSAGPSLFLAPVPDSGSGGRQHGLLAAAAVVALLVGGGAAVMFISGRGPAVSAAATSVPLELVALSHARTTGQLAVVGVVRNPQGGAALEQVEAHVRVFDAAGILIATRSGPVDAVSLVPGHDAAFTIALGEATTAARYRVSFASRGTMLAHVDRRTNLPAAVTADAR